MKNNFILISNFYKIALFYSMVIILTNTAYSQSVSTFDNLLLTVNSYWNGSDLSGGFSSGNAFFTNRFDTAFGGSWSGFVYSDMTNDSTTGYSNQYSAITGIGYNNSNNYGLFYYSPYSQTSRLKLFSRDTVLGFYITNSTWAALSMLNGDAFAKKFGGTSGNDPDWFKLSITGYYNGNAINDTVNYYLADYRFINNSQDYIITSWNWVNLSSLGLIDSLEFLLSSSDTGIYGMNTPAYFCLDNFTTKSNISSIPKFISGQFEINTYPNPAKENINVDLINFPFDNYLIEIIDMSGKIKYSRQLSGLSCFSINLKFIPQGLYFLKIKSNNVNTFKRFVKL